jgi:hypothetical protein
LCAILGDAAVAHLAVAELAFRDSEGVLDLGAHAAEATIAGTLPSLLEGVIEPHFPKTGPQGGRRSFPLAVTLRTYCQQQWYNL